MYIWAKGEGNRISSLCLNKQCSHEGGGVLSLSNFVLFHKTSPLNLTKHQLVLPLILNVTAKSYNRPTLNTSHKPDPICNATVHLSLPALNQMRSFHSAFLISTMEMFTGFSMLKSLAWRSMSTWHLTYIVTCHSSRHHVYLCGVGFQHTVQFLFGSGVSSKVDCSVGKKRQNGTVQTSTRQNKLYMPCFCVLV